MDGFAGDVLSGGRALLGEDSSVVARMQKTFWKTKQVLIKATGKKEDDYVVASDADLDAKLELFHSVQTTSTELLKVIEKYQRRITHLSQEENEFGMFLRFQAEHDRTKAGNMMGATSKALCASAKQRLVLRPSLHRMEQEVETFRRRAIADTLLTVTRMEKSRTEYRGALLWMKDVSQELDPDTCKHLDKFRKVQSQVRGSKDLFEKLKNDVCQKIDMLGASRCNMLSHSLCTYQITLLQFWERTADVMSGIHESFKGLVPYQFTTLKDLRDPLEQLTDLENQDQNKEKAIKSNSLVSLDEEKPSESAFGGDLSGSALLQQGLRVGDKEEEDRETGDMAFLKDLLSPGPMEADEFSREWQGTFGCLEFSDAVPHTAPTPSLVPPPPTGAACPPSQSPSPTGFLPSQLLDHSLSSTGWATPPMFQAPPLQSPVSGQVQSAKGGPKSTANVPKGAPRDMSAWFNLFADLDPLSNPDAIGRSEDEILNA
ncbi:islet cell autoantigen 1-like protein isoform X3 [Salvelinus fontinalis]|uniref:islet cell autoantigen 1-like protein isoform X3 n=1 Tax=Salvelinus fontinalis TaxID=8038 RepID=UPI0024860D22|nr:islet cell autoantigen 1-like protein isoform X3 [Salvelinus fontinalis]